MNGKRKNNHAPGRLAVVGPLPSFPPTQSGEGDYLIMHNTRVIGATFRIVGPDEEADAEANAALFAAAPRMLELLKALEWSGVAEDDSNYGACPVCEWPYPNHAGDGCALNEVIKEAEGYHAR